MVPTALSQIIEQILNAVVSVGAAIWLSELAAKSLEDDSTRRAYGAAGGTIGTGAGALFALVILLIWFFVSYKSYARVGSGEKKKKESYKQITRLLIYNVVPVIASTAVYNINSIIDTSIFGNLMQYLGSAKVDNAKQYGIYTSSFNQCDCGYFQCSLLIIDSNTFSGDRCKREGKGQRDDCHFHSLFHVGGVAMCRGTCCAF